jgi:16S rRNA (uracil1498-N3)-methyltransferase
MKLQRFFVEHLIGNEDEVSISSPELAHQLRDVFRFRGGESVVLFDNSGFEYVSQIVSLSSKNVMFHASEKRRSINVPRLNVILYQSIIKKDKFEWVIEKATEIGVSQIVPVVSQRSEKKDLNRTRCIKILTEASEQSERSILPILTPPLDIMDVISDIDVSKNVLYIVLDPTGSPVAIPKIVSDAKDAHKDIHIFIGPEGGWTQEELQGFTTRGAAIGRLGSSILKAETAAIATVSLLLLG